MIRSQPDSRSVNAWDLVFESRPALHVVTKGAPITFRHINNHAYRYSMGERRPSLTFAIRRNGDTLSFGVAECSVKDSFCKRSGRQLACSRLHSAPWVAPYVHGLSYLECIQLHMRSVYRARLALPRWAKALPRAEIHHHQEPWF